MRGLRFVWPMPAMLSWASSWALFAVLTYANAPLPVAIGTAGLAGAALSVLASTSWRRVFIVLGFPLSLAASGLAASMPAWGWLMPLALLALVYPINAWRDAPVFPTPAGALEGLARAAPLARNARVLDAGCGLGDGLRELHREYPGATLVGIEWSWPLRLLCAGRCRFAEVRRADMWSADWSSFNIVYLFQRPESMARAVAKAQHELRAGAWLVSLEFDAAGLVPTGALGAEGGRRVWLYQAPFRTLGPKP